MMKVLLVNGSPHEKGCTYTALCEVARALKGCGVEAEIFWIGKKAIGGCVACYACGKLGRCVFDDAVNEFAAKAAGADGFVFGSPVYFAGMAGNMVSFMDRLFYSARNGSGEDAFALKPVAAVVSARRAGTTATFEQLNKYFAISEMPVISSCYWNLVHGTEPREVLQDLEGLRTMRVLGRNMAYFLKCRAAGAAAGVPLPEAEPPVKTNFIR